VMASSRPNSVALVVLDIEGTTTSISFVADVMFPYVRRHLQAYLDENWENVTLRADVKLLRELSQEDVKNNVSGVPVIPEDGDKAAVLSRVVENVTWQMDQDRKSTELKALQGHMWESGFESGELVAHIYEDVVPFLMRMEELSIPVYIYSSGSVHAQKLLFGHTATGDLLHFFRGHFDTTIGLKVESSSYENISKQVGIAAENTLFATDNIFEAYAAEKAGWNVALADRPGNKELPEGHHFLVVDSLLKLLNGTNKFTFPKDIQRVPRVGIAVAIVRKSDGKVLVGKRLGSHGQGSYAFPGGHLDFGETWEKGASREVLEETGLEIENLRLETVVNDISYHLHYIVLVFTAHRKNENEEPRLMEAHKCEEWIWVDWDSFPQPWFSGIQRMKEAKWSPGLSQFPCAVSNSS